jgi:DNA polymerase-3 subunit alpha
VEKEIANQIADQVVTFGRYGFPRAHSVAYALLSYQTAWLKRHYPAEFIAALLSSVLDKTEDVVHYISECRELARVIPGRTDGVRVLAPDVNESEWKFTPVSDTEIRFGLGALRGVGEGAVRSILDNRRAAGPYTSLFNLAERVDLRLVGKRSLEALILSGACDSFSRNHASGAGHRAMLLGGLDMVVREAQLRHEEKASGQVSLFDLDGPGDAPARPEPALPEVERWPEAVRLAKEKEILGFFISGHPLEKFRDELRVFSGCTTATLKQFKDQKVELPCVVTGVTRQVSRRDGSEWGRITVEDFHGTATVLAFRDAWDQYHDLMVQDAAVLLRGSVSGRERDEDAPPLFLDSVVPLQTVRGSGTLGVEVALPEDAPGEALTRAAEAFREHPGAAPVFVRWAPVSNGNGGADCPEGVRLRSRTVTVSPSEALMRELRELFGAESVRLVRAAGTAAPER